VALKTSRDRCEQLQGRCKKTTEATVGKVDVVWGGRWLGWEKNM